MIGFFFLVIWISTAVSVAFFAIVSRRVFAQVAESEVKKIARISSLIAVMSIQMFFLSTIPLTVDRSYSVWLLARSEISDKEFVTLAKLEADTQNFFIGDGSELKKRMNEQSRLGNLKWNSSYSAVSLSNRGKFQVRFNRLVSSFFGLNPKYAAGGP
jgi:hypothetical protein